MPPHTSSSTSSGIGTMGSFGGGVLASYGSGALSGCDRQFASPEPDHMAPLYSSLSLQDQQVNNKLSK